MSFEHDIFSEMAPLTKLRNKKFKNAFTNQIYENNYILKLKI